MPEKSDAQASPESPSVPIGSPSSGPPAWAWGALIVLAAASSFYTSTAPDYWFHLGAGRSIAEHGLPAREAWCLSARGQPALLAGWPYQLALHQLHRLGGDLGVALWRAGWAALAAVLAIALVRRIGAASWTTWLLVPLVIAASRDALRARPEQVLLALVLFALYELENGRRAEKDRTRRLIPAQAIWANAHPAWVLGPVIAWIYSLTEWWRESDPKRAAATNAPPSRSRTWMVLGLVLWAASALTRTPLVTLATPFHFLQPFRHDHLTAPIDLYRRWSWAQDRLDPFTALAALSLVAAVVGGRRVWREAPGLGLVSIASIALGFYSAQFRDLAAWTALPSLALALRPEAAGWRARLRAAPALAAAALGVFWLATSTRFPLGVEPDRRAMPVQAVALAESLGIRGAPLHTVETGGYVLATRGDRNPPLVDFRLRGNQALLYRYDGALRVRLLLDSFFEEYEISHVIAPPARRLGDAFASNMAQRLEWGMISYEDAGCLFVRWKDHPEAAARSYRYLSTDPVAMNESIERCPSDSGLARRLEAELLRARAASPRHARASVWLGELAFALGRTSEALRHLEEAQRIAPDTPRLASALGRAYMAVGDHARANVAFERARRQLLEDQTEVLEEP